MAKDVTVRLRLEAAEARAWRAAAAQAGLSLSDWIRRRVAGERVIEVPAPVPKRRPRPQ